MVIKKIIKKPYNILKLYGTDIQNIFKYGLKAPLFAETIFVNPRDVSSALTLKTSSNSINVRKLSGSVISDKTFNKFKEVPLAEWPKFKYCIDHWIYGKSWEEAGAYKFMDELIKERGRVDNCSSMDDVYLRYKKLDKIFEKIKSEQYFPTRKELNKNKFREQQGVLIHIGPNGEPYASGGAHRFAIAYVLNLTFPAQLGMVHKDGLRKLDQYRRSRLIKM